MNSVDLRSLCAGSKTNSPGLSFATNVARSDAPNVAYPLTTLLRILSAQVLAIVLFR